MIQRRAFRAGGPPAAATAGCYSEQLKQAAAAHCSSSSIEETDGASDRGASECSSSACSEQSRGNAPQLIGPRPTVLRRLCRGEQAGRLPAAVREAATELEAACGAPTVAAAHRQLTAALQGLHGAVVAADHGLCEAEPPRPGGAVAAAGAALLAEEARQWLKEAQAYVLHVQAQAGSLAGANGTGVAEAWSYLAGEAARCLARISRQMEAGGGGELVTYGALPLRAGGGPRRLVPVACMPYSSYWAKAVAI